MPSSLRPLRHRNFALIWTAALLSNVGSWMQTVAVGVFVTARTGQASWTGLVAGAAFLPIGLLSPLGGLMADRMDRRKWLFVTTVGETVSAVLLTLLAVGGRATPQAVTLLVLAGGAMSAVGFPAYQAMLPSLVPPEELGPAISLSSAQFNLGRVIGPALAGVVIVAGGYGWAFAINAASFLAVLAALGFVRLPAIACQGRVEPMLRRLGAGLRATLGAPAARLAVILIAVVAITASPFIALIPAVALKAFHSKASGTSALVSAQGVGAVCGSLALTPLALRFGRRAVLLGDLLGVCLLLVAYGLSPSLLIASAAMVVLGAAYIGVLAGCNTIVQLSAPEELRGRMLGLYMMALGVLYPIGAVAQGWIADVVGIRAVTVGGGLLLLVLVLVAFRRPILEGTDPGEPLQAPTLSTPRGSPVPAPRASRGWSGSGPPPACE